MCHVSLPPLTTPLVQMADIDRQVVLVTTILSKTTTIPSPETHTQTLLDNLEKCVWMWKVFVWMACGRVVLL